jgi:hypothetical protein
VNDLQSDIARAVWRTSSHSGSGDQCVEVSALGSGDHAVRDSKDVTGPVLLFSRREWHAFVGAVKAGPARALCHGAQEAVRAGGRAGGTIPCVASGHGLEDRDGVSRPGDSPR